MELVFGDKLQVIRPTFLGRRFVNVLTDCIFVKVCLNGVDFYYHLLNACPKELQFLPLTSIVTVNTKPYK